MTTYTAFFKTVRGGREHRLTLAFENKEQFKNSLKAQGAHAIRIIKGFDACECNNTESRFYQNHGCCESCFYGVNE